MPAVGGTFSSIDSLEEIPKEIMDKIDSIEFKETKTNIISGKSGEISSNVASFFSDKNKMYFGHGTSENKNVLDSILEKGLHVTDPEGSKICMSSQRGLGSTTVYLGLGEENLYNNQQNLLDNWGHKYSKTIVIVELPSSFIIDFPKTSINDFTHNAFYYNINEEGYLRPEFIRGYYDANTKKFVPNVNYIENLSEAEKERVLNEVKDKFLNEFAKFSSVEPNESLGLSKEDLQKAKELWYKSQYEEYLSYIGNMSYVTLEEKEEVNEDNWINFDDEEEKKL